jgi:hypothetical protein
VGGGGDLDADGLDDLLVGADGEDSAATDAGAVYVLLAADLSTFSGDLGSASAILLGEDADDQAGAAVCLPGDVGGDGHDDVFVGSWADDAGGVNAGRAYLVDGATLAGGLRYDLRLADHSFIGEYTGDEAGYSISGAGDIDLDGQVDLFIGGPENDEAAVNAGTAYLMLSGSLPSTRSVDLSLADFRFTGEYTADNAGYGVGSAGDFNGDGMDDLLLGAPGNDDGGIVAGKAYVVLNP